MENLGKAKTKADAGKSQIKNIYKIQCHARTDMNKIGRTIYRMGQTRRKSIVQFWWSVPGIDYFTLAGNTILIPTIKQLLLESCECECACWVQGYQFLLEIWFASISYALFWVVSFHFSVSSNNIITYLTHFNQFSQFWPI